MWTRSYQRILRRKVTTEFTFSKDDSRWSENWGPFFSYLGRGGGDLKAGGGGNVWLKMLWPSSFPIICAQTCQYCDFRIEVPLHAFFSKTLLQGPRRGFQSAACLGGNRSCLELKLGWKSFHPYSESVLMLSIDNPTSREPPGPYSNSEQTLAPPHLFVLLYCLSTFLGRPTATASHGP